MHIYIEYIFISNVSYTDKIMNNKLECKCLVISTKWEGNRSNIVKSSSSHFDLHKYSKLLSCISCSHHSLSLYVSLAVMLLKSFFMILDWFIFFLKRLNIYVLINSFILKLNAMLIPLGLGQLNLDQGSSIIPIPSSFTHCY